jgi:hypothetical protein
VPVFRMKWITSGLPTSRELSRNGLELAGWPILNFAFFAKFRVGMLDAAATSMKSPCAVNLRHAVTASQQRLGKRVAQLSSARMHKVCAALRFSLACDSN